MSARDRMLTEREQNTYDLSDRLPDSPTETIPFSIYSRNVSFTPNYYPSRMSITTKKDFEKVDAGCEGQKIDISQLKNSTLHVQGKVHASDMGDLNDLAHTTDKLDVLTPILENGGMEFYCQAAERGELIGFDAFPLVEEWMFKYSIDLVSTGKDEYQNETEQPERFTP